MKLHQKGFLLVELEKVPSLWDDAIVEMTLKAYGQSGSYCGKAVRVALEELAAAGLISRVETKLRPQGQKPVLSFRYAVTDFGRTRMADTGLLKTQETA